jgi:hypothetical protein
MTEVPRVELPSLQAQSDQVVRMGGARAAARDSVDRADRDYELELRSLERSEEVAESERISSTDGRRQRHEEERGNGKRGEGDDDDSDDEPHLVDVMA